MRYSITRKINLSNIDQNKFAYETEDLTVHEADSFDEACKEIDRITAERVGFYKAIQINEKKVEPAPATQPTEPAQTTAPVPPQAPGAINTVTPPPPASTSQPPADLA